MTPRDVENDQPTDPKQKMSYNINTVTIKMAATEDALNFYYCFKRRVFASKIV